MANKAKFDALVGVLAPDLFRYAFWLSRDRELAQDLVQDTMLRAWRALDKLRDQGSIKHWLFTILRREHARHYERKRLETVDIDTPGLADENLAVRAWDSDVDDLRNAMMKLEDDYREPLVLQVMAGYSTKEIAEHMSLTQGAVLTRLFRARRQLQQHIGGADDVGGSAGSRR